MNALRGDAAVEALMTTGRSGLLWLPVAATSSSRAPGPLSVGRQHGSQLLVVGRHREPLGVVHCAVPEVRHPSKHLQQLAAGRANRKPGRLHPAAPHTHRDDAGAATQFVCSQRVQHSARAWHAQGNSSQS